MESAANATVDQQDEYLGDQPTPGPTPESQAEPWRTDPQITYPERFTDLLPPEDYPAAPVFPPHSRLGCTPSSHHKQGAIRSLSREFPSCLLPDLSDDLGVTTRDQYVLGVRSLALWEIPLRPVRYPEHDGPRARKKKYWCPPGCYAAVLASRYDVLPFTHAIALTAPPGCFEDWFVPWAEESFEGWWAVTKALSFPDQAIWLGAKADRPTARIPGSGEDPHVHLVVGNVPLADIMAAVERWPLGRPSIELTPLYHVWGKLHYMLTQSPVDTESDELGMARRKYAHHRNLDALILPLIKSPTLEPYALFMKHRLAVYRSKRRSSAWGRRMARRRWQRAA